MTVGDGPINGFVGGNHGALDDRTFEYGGTEYTVDAVVRGGPFFNRLTFNLDGADFGANDVLTLHVGDRAYPFSDAALVTSEHSYQWTH